MSLPPQLRAVVEALGTIPDHTFRLAITAAAQVGNHMQPRLGLTVRNASVMRGCATVRCGSEPPAARTGSETPGGRAEPKRGGAVALTRG